MKEFCGNYSIAKKHKNTAEKFELEAKLKSLSKLISSNCSDEVRKEYEKGEKSNKYFFNLEKRNKSKTHLSCLIENNKIITDQDTIQKDLKKFYSYLYTRKSLKSEKECLEFLADINTPLLSSDNQKVCDTSLTLMELYDALNGMPASKTPGNDGLTKEFYIAFFDKLGPWLIKCLNFAFEKGVLTTSQRQAVITLAEKKEKISVTLKTGDQYLYSM